MSSDFVQGNVTAWNGDDLVINLSPIMINDANVLFANAVASNVSTRLVLAKDE